MKRRSLPRRARRRARGFSLIEVVLSGAILLVGLAGTLSGLSTALSVYENDRRRTMALSLCEGQLEQLLLRFRTSSDLEQGLHPGPDFDAAGRPVAAGSGAYQSSWTVTPNVPITGMRRVEVSVTWPGATRPTTLATFRE